MTVTALAPAAGVFAAKAPALSAKSKTLLLNDEDRTEYDFNIKYKVKGSKYEWSTSNEDVVTVASNGLVEAVAVGSAKVTVEITLPTGKTKKLTAPVKVKENMDTITISNPATEAIAIGESYNFNRDYTTVTGGKTTDITRWEIVSDNADKASIKNNGVITATEVGEYEVVAMGFQSVAKYNEYLAGDTSVVTAKSAVEKIVVEPSMVAVAQKTSAQFEITFDADMSEVVTKATLEIKNSAGVKLPIIKEVKFDETGKVATVTTFIDLTDKEVYTVSHKELSKDFVASVGAVANVVITGPSAVAYNQPKEITVDYYDANGVKVSGNANNLSLEITNSIGWLDGTNLTLFNIGDKAVVKATYKTGLYDASWNEIVITSAEYVVTAVESLAATTNGITSWTIADSGKVAKDVDYTKVSTSLPVNVTTKAIYVKGINSSKEAVYDFTFESTDTTKLIVNPNTGALIPVATGTVGVIATSGNFKTVLNINITAKTEAANLTADKNTAVVSSTIAQEAKFTLTLNDQYTSKIAVTNTADVKVTSLSAPADSFADTLVSKTLDDGKAVVTFASATAKDGNYVYRVEIGGKSTILTITVKSGDDTKATSYRISLDTNSADVAINNDSDGNKTVKVTVLGYDVKGTAVVDLTTSAALQYKLTTDSSVTGSVVGGEIDLTNSTKVGTYVVTGTVTVDSKVVNLVTTAYEVKNSQVKAVASKEKAQIETAYSTLVADLISNEVFKVTSKADASTITFAIGDYTTTLTSASPAGTYNVLVRTLKVTETFANGAVSTYDLTVNEVIGLVIK
jgi:hypothetical protein